MTATPGQGAPPPGADDERGPLTVLLDQCERIVQVHERLRMDTPADETLRTDVVATTRAALDQCRDIARELVPLSRYSAALDEVYALRARMAYEAACRDADLTYATYPKSRRKVAEQAAERMRACARGQWRSSHDETLPYRRLEHLKESLRTAGASPVLTRSQWEQEQDRPAEEARDA